MKPSSQLVKRLLLYILVSLVFNVKIHPQYCGGHVKFSEQLGNHCCGIPNPQRAILTGRNDSLRGGAVQVQGCQAQ